MERRAQEIERIRAAYSERDAASPAASSPWLDPAYRFQLHEIEWALLDGLAGAGVELQGARVAEVGCGLGYFLSRFLDYGAGQASGIDLMEDRVARARDRIGDVALARTRWRLGLIRRAPRQRPDPGASPARGPAQRSRPLEGHPDRTGARLRAQELVRGTAARSAGRHISGAGEPDCTSPPPQPGGCEVPGTPDPHLRDRYEASVRSSW